MWWLPAALGALSSSLTLLFVCLKKRETKPVSKKGGSSKASHSQSGKARNASSLGVSSKSSKSASAKSAKLSQAKKASVASSASSKSASGRSAKSGKPASERQKNLQSAKSGGPGKSAAHGAESLKSAKTASAGGSAPRPFLSSLAPAAAAPKDESQKKPAILGQPNAVGIAKKPEKSAKSGRSKKSGRSPSRKSLSKTRPNFGNSKLAAGSAALSEAKAAPPADGAALSQPASQPLLIPTAAVPMQLQLAPADLRFSAAGGLSQVSVLNTTDKRRAIKVKCSDNQLYRVNPVHAFVEPCDTLRIDVLRQNSAAKTDKIVVLAADATKEDTDARVVTARAAAPELMLLPLIANAAE